jgi:hypothetical protein
LTAKTVANDNFIYLSPQLKNKRLKMREMNIGIKILLFLKKKNYETGHLIAKKDGT